MHSKLVSIITPAYNSARFIGETIESVQSQTYDHWEMIIVDDCSSDDTQAVVTKYMEKDNRIKYSRLKQNLGAAMARNKALEMANGEYIAFLDSDDIWLDSKLEIQIKFMEENNYNITCTSYEQMNEKGIATGKIIKAIPRTSYNRLLLDCPVGNSTVVYNARNMGKILGPNIRKRNDYALWLKILKIEAYIRGIPQVLVRYRLRENSVSSNKMSLVKYQWHVYRKFEKLSVFRSAFHVCYWGIIKILKIK